MKRRSNLAFQLNCGCVGEYYTLRDTRNVFVIFTSMNQAPKCFNFQKSDTKLIELFQYRSQLQLFPVSLQWALTIYFYCHFFPPYEIKKYFQKLQNLILHHFKFLTFSLLSSLFLVVSFARLVSDFHLFTNVLTVRSQSSLFLHILQTLIRRQHRFIRIPRILLTTVADFWLVPVRVFYGLPQFYSPFVGVIP